MTTQRHPALRATTTAARPIAPASPDVEAFTHSLVQWYLEFRAGRRSVEQLRPHLSGPMLRRLQRRASSRLSPPPVRPVVRVVVQQRDQHTFSMVAVIRHADRCGSLAGQLRHDGTRWLVTELTAPEDGERPVGDLRRRSAAELEDEFDDLVLLDAAADPTSLVA